MAGNITKRYEADYAREVHSMDADERSYYGTGTFYIPSAEEHGLLSFAGVTSGEQIGGIPAPGEEKDAWQKLAAGFSADGEPLTKNAGAENRVAAFDFTFTAPKGVSVLWGVAKISGSRLADEIDGAMVSSSKASLQLLQERAAFGVVRDANKKAHLVPVNIISGIFAHETSRADDPHKHTHNLIMNVGQVRDPEDIRKIKGDGHDKEIPTHLCLESRYLMLWQNAAASIGHVELAWRLKEHGISIRGGEFTFDVKHIPSELEDLWSKRVKQTELHATAYAIGMRGDMPSALQREYLAAAAGIVEGEEVERLSGRVLEAANEFRDRLEADYSGSIDSFFEANRDIWRTARMDTREDKTGITNSELYARWSEDLKGLGLSAEEVIEATLAAHYDPEPKFDREAAMDKAEAEAMVGSWVSEPQLYRFAFDSVTGYMSVEDAKRYAEEFIQERMIKIGFDPIRQTSLYTTQEMLAIEQTLLDTVVNAKHEALDQGVVREVMAAASQGEYPMTEEQQAAALNVMQGDQAVSVIEGTAGAGKSFTMKTIVEAYKKSGYEVHATALTWKASDVLKTSTNMDKAKAQAGFLNDIDRGKIALTNKSLVVLDEAGLVGSRQMQKLLSAVEAAGAKIILSGDRKQLSPVEGSSILKTIVREIQTERKSEGYSRIDFIYRQKNEEHRQAVYKFMDGRAGEAIATYVNEGSVKMVAGGNKAAVLSAVESAWAYAEKQRAAGKPASQLILAVDNDSVSEANTQFQRLRIKAGDLKESEAVNVHGKSGAMLLMPGDRIQFRINDKADENDNRRFKNRDGGEILAIEKGESPDDPAMLTIKVDNGQTLRIKTNDERLVDERGRTAIDLSYAVSVYSSQGMTVEHVDLIANEKYDRELSYVGASRHTHELKLHVNRDSLAEQWNASQKEDEQKPIKQITDDEILGQMASTWSRVYDPGSAIEMLRINERMSQAEIREIQEKAMLESRLNMKEQREAAAEAIKSIKARLDEQSAFRAEETKRAMELGRKAAEEVRQRIEEERKRREQEARRGVKL
jgi:conjugative relaxase-like TrwC/TraI family protein